MLLVRRIQTIRLVTDLTSQPCPAAGTTMIHPKISFERFTRGHSHFFQLHETSRSLPSKLFKICTWSALHSFRSTVRTSLSRNPTVYRFAQHGYLMRSSRRKQQEKKNGTVKFQSHNRGILQLTNTNEPYCRELNGNLSRIIANSTASRSPRMTQNRRAGQPCSRSTDRITIEPQRSTKLPLTTYAQF